MRLDPDDPRITAYVLGELSPEETSEIEAILEASPEDRQAVDEIRRLADALEEAIRDEDAPGLHDHQIREIERQAAGGGVPVQRIRMGLVLRWSLAAAALVVVSTVLFSQLLDRSAGTPAPDGTSASLQQKRTEPADEGRLMLGRDDFASVGGKAATEDRSRDGATLSASPVSSPPQSLFSPEASPQGGDAFEKGVRAQVQDSMAPAAPSEAFVGRISSHGAPEGQVPASGRTPVDGPVPAPGLTSGQKDTLGLGGGAGGAYRKAGEDLRAELEELGYLAECGGGPVGGSAPGAGGEKGGSRAGVRGRLKKETAGEEKTSARYDKVQNRLVIDAGKAGLSDAVDADGNVSDEETLRQPSAESSTEDFARVHDNPFVRTGEEPLSTFSIDVDTASYSNVRRFLNEGRLPPPDAVRIEELLNYFSYDDPGPAGSDPFGVNIEIGECPWEPSHRLARIGVKGRELDGERPGANLVFLVDVSGSMDDRNKLPLLIDSLAFLVESLDGRDRVAIAVYAGRSGLVLPSTPGDDHAAILGALGRLSAGGSTNGGEGIVLAYDVAQKGFVEGGINRVILCTDGDLNVGITSEGDLVRLIEEKRKSGVFLTVLGFGTDNLKDSKLEKLADHGNGQYAYVDSLGEARRIFGERLMGTLLTIAKDVKIQVDFNPREVASYRLLGYENRKLAARDFADDTKDAGEIGVGHSVTALYELVPAGQEPPASAAPPATESRFLEKPQPSSRAYSGEAFVVRMRYKAPDGDTSQLLEFPARDGGADLSMTSTEFRFATAVASFGMMLRQSPHRGNSTFAAVQELAAGCLGADEGGHRAEFLELVRRAAGLEGR